MDLSGMRVLVVGANGALGSLMAGELAARGAAVIGTARSPESSASLPEGLAERLVVDLAEPDSIAVLAAYLNSAPGGLAGVVNAAGAVGFGTIADTSAEQSQQLMQVNHLGPADLISQLMPALAAGREAGASPFVVSITGVVAERAFPGMAAYVASKTAHSAWLSVLRLEGRRLGIAVLDARPGHTETGLATRARFGAPPAMPAGLDPREVVSVIVAGIESGAPVLTSAEFS